MHVESPPTRCTRSARKRNDRTHHRTQRGEEVLRPGDGAEGSEPQGLPGRVTALVGDNGAGKSTLIKGLAGVQPYDEGEVLIDGRHHDLHTPPREAGALGIEVVYQDLALCDNLDIVQNMFLGREELATGTLDEGRMEKEASDTLRSLSVRTVRSIRQKVSSLSGGQRQTVAIARAVLKKARVVILDEPTAALGVAQTEQVLALVRRLSEQASPSSSSATTSPTSSRSPTTSPCSTSARWSPNSTRSTPTATTSSATSPARRRKTARRC